MSNKIFRMAFPLARGWTPATTLRIGMKRVLGGLLALALPLLLAVPPANATSTLRLDDGVNPVVDFVDNGASDTDPTLGIIDPASVGLGAFTLINVVGTIPLNPGLPPDPVMTLSGVVGTRNNPGTLTVLITQTDFTGLMPLFGDIFGNVFAGPGNNVTYTAYADAGNMPFVNGTPIGTTGPIVTVGQNLFAGGFGPSPLGLAGFFSVTLEVIISQRANTGTNFSAQLSQVPEPSTVLLLGSGLAGLVAWRMRKAKV